MPLKLMVPREVAPSEIHGLVFGTGALVWEWWGDARFVHREDEKVTKIESEEEMTEGAYLQIRALNPDTEKFTIHTLTMQEIVNAAGVVLAADRISEESAKDMRVEDLGYADAGDADLILQQAVFGRIIYG